MTTRAGALRVLLLAVSLGSSGTAGAGEAADRHADWRSCLHRRFALQATHTTRTRAAEAALRACQGDEAAYLTALSASPLLDGDDVTRVRPALLQKAMVWLIAGGARPL